VWSSHSEGVPITAEYKGLALPGAYRADLVVEGRLIVELKTIDRLDPVHKAQLLTYLRWSELKLGLLLNFNVRLLKSGVPRVVNRL